VVRQYSFLPRRPTRAVSWRSDVDQFDMAESFLTVSIALCGVTALTRRRWLFGLAVFFALSGLLLEFGGFMQWSFHPDWLAKLLG